MRKRLAAIGAAIAAFVALVLGHAAVQTPTAPAASSGCALHADYPDPMCTPGALDPRVTQATIRSTICVPGYTATVRRTSQALKDQVLAEYDLIPPFPGEIDHFVSLELGGADTITNLWPEAGKIPNPKDAVENRLHRAVCNGTMTLAEAQSEVTHWTEHR